MCEDGKNSRKRVLIEIYKTSRNTLEVSIQVFELKEYMSLTRERMFAIITRLVPLTCNKKEKGRKSFMSIYEKQSAEIIPSALEYIFPNRVQRHISLITDASPTSKFYWNTEDKASTVYVYLIEDNCEERYTICHLFSYDHIGVDYLYQSLPLEQIRVFEKFASQLFMV